jgi:tetratricopeptide (TPR) repeat protein
MCPDFIGRAPERDALYRLIDRTRSGQGRVALVSGEAGIGKSRLVAEAKADAAAQDFLLLQGSCFQMDSSYPYAPLLELLRASAAPTPDTPDPDPIILEFARLLPELALSLPGPLPAPLSDPEQEKRRLFAALTRFFKERVSQRPVLLVIEDLHWCDDISLEFFQSLARFCTAQPLLFLMTYRSDEVQPSLQRFLAQLDRARLSQEVRLVPLSRSEVDAMLGAMFALPDIEQAKLLDLIYPLSEGNPFFVEEILTSLVSRGELFSDDGIWQLKPHPDNRSEHMLVPRSVKDAVQQRTEQLSTEGRQVVTFAAVAGRRFDFAVLQQVMHCDEDRLLLLIKELLAIQFVVEVSAEQFAFRHALTQQAVYAGLLARERRSLHRTLAEAIEELSVTTLLIDAHLADLAYHYYEAGVWAKALEYEQRAGERALALYAPRAAIEHVTHALDAACELDITPPGKVYHARGQAYETLGEFDRARSDYERALDAAHTASDGSMEWQSMMALGFLWAERDYAQAGEWFRRASDLAERLADPTLQARSLNRLGNWLGNTGRNEEGLQAHQEALRIFEEQQNTQGMAETLDLLGTTYGMRGDRVKAVEQLGQAIALFRTLGDTQSLISSLAMRAVQSMPGSNETTYCPLRTPNECVQDASESLRLARQIDSLAGQAFAENSLAHILLSFGEFGPALSHAQEARRIATEIEHQQWMVSTYFCLGHIYLLLLAPAPAMTALEVGLSLAQELGSTFWIATLAAHQGRAYILKHDLPAARATLQAIMPCEQHPRTMAERQIALAWGELVLAQGEPGIALQIAEQLLTSAPGKVPGQSTQPIPHLLKLKGEALMALSHLDEAVEALEDARLGAQERNARPVLWIIHRSLGQAYQLLQRKDQARQERAVARQLIEELAIAIDDAPLREQFLRAALDSFPKEKPPLQREAARHAFGGLTAREREVAALIAQGKTSREIADLLVVSERTAEVHVSNILGKLGFTSRAQIAVWIVERGLTKH